MSLNPDPPPWFDTAAVACAFLDVPGAADGPEAFRASEYLNAAGIPTYVAVESDSDGRVSQEYMVYVPGNLALKAAAVLEVNIFNVEVEETWRTHLQSFSDDELPEVAPDIVCAGLQDRINRITRAYEEKLTRRGL